MMSFFLVQSVFRMNDTVFCSFCSHNRRMNEKQLTMLFLCFLRGRELRGAG